MARIFDTVADNPYVHFLVSEIWAGVTGLLVYVLFRCLAWSTQLVTTYVPVHDDAPGIFLETVLSWGAAISASGTFIIISIYQFVILIKRLWKAVQS